MSMCFAKHSLILSQAQPDFVAKHSLDICRVFAAVVCSAHRPTSYRRIIHNSQFTILNSQFTIFVCFSLSF